jgi:hypothetical protein
MEVLYMYVASEVLYFDIVRNTTQLPHLFPLVRLPATLSILYNTILPHFHQDSYQGSVEHAGTLFNCMVRAHVE